MRVEETANNLLGVFNMTVNLDRYASTSDGTSRRTGLIRVLVADDNVQLRWAIMEALISLGDFEVVEEASNGFEAVEKARSQKPHVVLMDLQMPDCDGVEATRLLQMEGSEAKVLINTVSEQETDLARALEAGARGYVLKSESMEMVVQAIHYVARGGVIVSPAMASKFMVKFNNNQPVPKLPLVGAPTPASNSGKPTTMEEFLVGKAVQERVSNEVAESDTLPGRTAPGVNGRQGRSSFLAETLDYDLVIAQPMEPSHALRLHKWLTGEGESEVEAIFPSLGGDTLVSVTYRGNEPLSSRLASLPMVASMTDESPEPTDDPDEPQTPRKRLRLVLQDA